MLVSANDDAKIAQRCLDCGASAFISKDHLIEQLPVWVVGAIADLARARAA